MSKTSQYSILTDTTLCIGCEKCVEACKKKNNHGPDKPQRWKKTIDDLSASRFTTIIRKQGNHHIRKQCRHCLKPACVSACLVGAMQRSPSGAVIYDANRCIGCRYCMVACPFEIPRYDWNKAVPFVQKCTLCDDRIPQGRPPACVEACPEKATIFGTREAMLAEAHRRIDRQPERYIGKVFGETEVGGTAVLYLSDISLSFLSRGTVLDDKPPLPDLTWGALSKVPLLVAGMGSLMAGSWWVIGRRMKRERERASCLKPDLDPSPAGAQDSSADEPEEEKKSAE